MSKVLEQLQRQRADYMHQIDDLRGCLRDLDLAISAIKGPQGVSEGDHAPRPKLRVTDALELAIKAGCGSPAAMDEYLRRELDLETTRATISSTLSRMKDTHNIHHDGTHWVFRNKPETSERNGSPHGEPSRVNGASTDAPEANRPD